MSFEQTVHDYYTNVANLLLKKHADYGPTNISNAPGGALNGLRVRIHDKIARINHLLDSGKQPQNESVKDSFMDLANYAIIALLVIDGKWPAEIKENADRYIQALEKEAGLSIGLYPSDYVDGIEHAANTLRHLKGEQK